MNILILAASPRTGSTFLESTVIPQKYFENFSYTPERRDKMWLSSPPELDHSMHVSPYGEIHLYGEHWSKLQSNSKPGIDKATMLAEWKWWYTIDPKNTIRVVKAFPNHFKEHNMSNIEEILKYTHKVYLLFRKDYTAVVYSQLAAFKTNNYTPDRETKTIDITKKEFEWWENQTFNNYSRAIELVRGWNGDLEVVCLEEDLPYQPYKNNYIFNNPQFEVDREFKKFYNRFRRLGLPSAVSKRFDK